jgi:hypothetical protein
VHHSDTLAGESTNTRDIHSSRSRGLTEI